MSSKAAILMTTVSNKDHASALAKILISSKAAACIQEIAINSHFNWDGKTNSEQEVLLLIKTAGDRIDFAIETIKSNHSYEVPEILVLPVSDGLPAYLAWVHAETRPGLS
jgi:periplasmic divalent cation tolerance protein